MIDLPVTDLRVAMACESDLRLGPFAGVPLLGSLKRRAREAACARRARCAGARCEAPGRCAYARWFEPGPARGLPRQVTPRVVVRPAEPDRTAWAEGDPFAFDLRLFGEPEGPLGGGLDVLHEAAQAVASRGLGSGPGMTGRVRYADAEAITVTLDVGPVGSEVLVELVTPLRLRPVRDRPDRLTPGRLAFAAAHRLRSLAETYGGDHDLPRPRDLAEASESIRVVRRSLRAAPAERKGSAGRHPADGLSGRVQLSGVPRGFGRALAAGAVVHLGAMTSSGYGGLSVWSRVEPGR